MNNRPEVDQPARGTGPPARESAQPVAAFVLSIIAGLWLLAGSLMMYGGYGMGPGYGGGYGHMGGEYSHMGGGYGHMGGAFPGIMGWMWHNSVTGSMGWLYFRPWFNVVGGIVLLVAGGLLYTRPEQRVGWGILILVVSTLSLFLGMGGFVAGVLGIIGGLLALIRPSPSA